MTEDDAFAKINQRRRQMHVHSVIYYHMHTNLIEDVVFDKWAVELAKLQTDYPQFKHKGYQYGMFENWTGDTGMHLPVTDEAYAMAEFLVNYKEKR